MAGQPNAGPNWKKRILIPFWVVRIIIMVFSLGTFIWAAVAISKNSLDLGYSKPAIGVVVITILLIVIVLLIDILAILMFVKNKLKPGTFVILNSVGTAFWGVILILEIAAVGTSNGSNGASIGLAVFIFLSFLGLLIYAAVMYHRERKSRKLGHYAPAHNPASPYTNSPYQQQTTAYTPASSDHHDLPEHYTKPSGGGADYNLQPVRPAQVV
ncbi:hypothetical protein B0J11DRAFT_173827 [Dendryphion nanum]|uniref:MARVEL domain-containing protein n=1 Tax=Dendryphion nanum TaxID=256645 RepID=A0A9P9EAV6_9PLEO|nr:hypothetical protein B0J11DRAFT_173827 [Dendryphion nanum]